MLHDAIVVAGTSEDQFYDLSATLAEEHYRPMILDSLTCLEERVAEDTRRLVILDLDTFPVDNRLIRNLKRQNPSMCILALSSRSFHPELEEAMRTHIFACLVKPIDVDELIYWVRSICKNWSA